MVMRRALFERLGPFDERFGSAEIRASEDTEFVFRAYLADVPIEYVPDMLVFHHHGRKKIDVGKDLMRNYLIGNGAVYAKYMFKDPNLCRQFYWDMKGAISEMVIGNRDDGLELFLSHKTRIAYNVIGAAKFLLAK
jgi:GT2 family glycosyltransferase